MSKSEIRKLARARGLRWQKGTRSGTYYCYFRLPGDDPTENPRTFYASQIHNTVTDLYEDLFHKYPHAMSPRLARQAI